MYSCVKWVWPNRNLFIELSNDHEFPYASPMMGVKMRIPGLIHQNFPTVRRHFMFHALYRKQPKWSLTSKELRSKRDESGLVLAVASTTTFWLGMPQWPGVQSNEISIFKLYRVTKVAITWVIGTFGFEWGWEPIFSLEEFLKNRKWTRIVKENKN